ncbi:MAG TPA: amidase family protein, partial [Acidimicrobiales bacterium]
MTGPVGAVGAVGGTGGARTGNVVGMDTVDTAGAFVGPALRIAGAPTGPLAGLTFAAKDLIDVAGVTTGAGNPEWARTHPPAAAHAPVVDALLAAGATLVGRTVTDELAYSLAGTNVHHGTPRNPRCPDRVPGGSSSGSASAVAGGAVDIGLGTDTGGSIRVPAAYCGIVGFRPTHGVVDMTGVVGLSPSFDTLGWLTRAVGAAARVAEVLLPRRPGPPGRHAEPAPPRLVVADDALAECVGGAGAAIEAALQALPVGAERTTLGPPGTLERWADAYRLLSGAEAWRLHG